MHGVNSAWRIKWESRAIKEAARLSKQERERLVTAADELLENPDKGQTLKGPWAGLRGLRVGNYRVIYILRHEKSVIGILRVGHRREVYR